MLLIQYNVNEPSKQIIYLFLRVKRNAFKTEGKADVSRVGRTVL
jgi:hypothetical protein